MILAGGAWVGRALISVSTGSSFGTPRVAFDRNDCVGVVAGGGDKGFEQLGHGVSGAGMVSR